MEARARQNRPGLQRRSPESGRAEKGADPSRRTRAAAYRGKGTGGEEQSRRKARGPMGRQGFLTLIAALAAARAPGGSTDADSGTRSGQGLELQPAGPGGP